MLKKRCFLLFLVLFLVPLVDAVTSDTLSSNFYKDNDTEIIDGKLFRFEINGVEKKVNVQYPEGGLILNNNSCDFSGIYYICASYMKEVSYNTTEDRYTYGAQVSVGRLTARIAMERLFEQQEILIGERVQVKVKLENMGYETATSILYQDSFPDNMEVRDATGCSIKDNGVEYKGQLERGQKVECIYYLKGVKETTYKSTGKLTYFDGNDIEKLDTPRETLKVPSSSLRIILNLTKNTTEIGEEFELYINLTNLNPEYMKINKFTITLPESMRLKFRHELTDSLYYHGSIPSEDSLVFRPRFAGERTGDYNIKVSINYQYGQTSFTFEKLIPVKVYSEDIEVTLSIPEKVKSGESKRIILGVKNPSKEYVFTDMGIKLDSDLPGLSTEEKLVPRLDKEEDFIIYNAVYDFPETENNRKYTVKLDIGYKTIYGEELSFSDFRQVSLNPNITEEVSEKFEEELMINEDVIVLDEQAIAVAEQKEETGMTEEPKETIKREINYNTSTKLFLGFVNILIILMIVSVYRKIRKD